jgi:hypothetical protein
MILGMDIKATVVGGRPSTGPMQSIAGVEGAQVFELNDISNIAAAAIELAPEDRKPDLMAGQLAVLAEGYALKRATTPSNAGALNGKNQFAKSNSQTPLQFLMQPANCRFFYTAKMLSTPELVWQRAVDATWTNPDMMCVQGSRITSNDSQTLDSLFRLGAVGSAAGTLNGSLLFTLTAAIFAVLVGNF